MSLMHDLASSIYIVKCLFVALCIFQRIIKGLEREETQNVCKLTGQRIDTETTSTLLWYNSGGPRLADTWLVRSLK